MNDAVQQKFDRYPANVKTKLMQIRALILALGDEESIGEICETLKWGEPSYLAEHGSTIRMNWKPKHPQQFSLYFNCKTILVETFKEIYPDTFVFVGCREMVFSLTEQIPIPQLQACLTMALRYHKIKHLPLLGA